MVTHIVFVSDVWPPKVFVRNRSCLSNDPGNVDSNFFCYAATVLSPHRNVLIFTQRMHKPTQRPFTQ